VLAGELVRLPEADDRLSLAPPVAVGGDRRPAAALVREAAVGVESLRQHCASDRDRPLVNCLYQVLIAERLGRLAQQPGRLDVVAVGVGVREHVPPFVEEVTEVAAASTG
jgi:hypothetical protein